MRIKTQLLAAAVGMALCCGYIALGQIKDPGKAAVKPPAAGTGQGSRAPAQPAVKTDKPAATAAPTQAKTDESVTGAESADEASIRSSAEAFTKLYNAHDAKGLGALFTPKAEIIDEDGNRVVGPAEIEQEFAEVFKQYPKASMEVDIESVRVLTSMLAIEEGTARSRNSPDDPEEATVYVAIHVKLDSKWQLACVRDWYAASEELTPHDHLEQELSWLLGDWVDESPDATIYSSCRWHDNGNFLMQEFHVNVGGQIAMSGTVRIGWNAVSKQFESWVFDSHGGHSNGQWSREGDTWIVKLRGATAAGEVGSSTNYYRPIDEDTLAWGSIDRLVDGEAVDDIKEIIVKRQAPPPRQQTSMNQSNNIGLAPDRRIKP